LSLASSGQHQPRGRTTPGETVHKFRKTRQGRSTTGLGLGRNKVGSRFRIRGFTIGLGLGKPRHTHN
jgi:hypothetical protein